MPSESPAALIEVSVFADVTDAEFHNAPAALVILERFETETLVLTKYNVPVSVLWPVADCVLRIDAVVALTVGAVMSFHCAYSVMSLAVWYVLVPATKLVPLPSAAVFQPPKPKPVRSSVPVFADTTVAAPALMKLVVVYVPLDGAVPELALFAS